MSLAFKMKKNEKNFKEGKPKEKFRVSGRQNASTVD